MGVLLDLLRRKKLLISDGAWGTMLQERGLGLRECPERWNLTHPDRVRELARAYIDAGSEIILSNTFGGSRYRLAKHGMGDRVAEINAAGAGLSLEAAAGRAVVAASVGGTGEFLKPRGDINPGEMEEVFREQIQALVRAGVRAVCIETMTAVEEAVLAVRAAKAVDPEVDVVCTMTFDPGPDGFRTMRGVSPSRTAGELAAAGADILGANCGNGMAQMIDLVAEYRAATGLPLAVHVNAGLPELVGGRAVYREDPESMAKGVERLAANGASIIGGCCGTTPAHIAAMAKRIRRLRGEE